MKKFWIIFVSLLMLLATCFSAYAGHFRARVSIGPVWWGYGHGYYGRPYIYPYPYPYPYYVERPVIIQQPDVYVQPAPATQPAPKPATWYYCQEPQGYYPYVKACPSGWSEVATSPSQPAKVGFDSNYWYYCQNPKGYYPYVKTCPEGWMKVVPTPPQSTDLKR